MMAEACGVKLPVRAADCFPLLHSTWTQLFMFVLLRIFKSFHLSLKHKIFVGLQTSGIVLYFVTSADFSGNLDKFTHYLLGSKWSNLMQLLVFMLSTCGWTFNLSFAFWNQGIKVYCQLIIDNCGFLISYKGPFVSLFFLTFSIVLCSVFVFFMCHFHVFRCSCKALWTVSECCSVNKLHLKQCYFQNVTY